MKQMNKPKSSSQQQAPAAPPVPNSPRIEGPRDKMRRLAEWILLPLRLFLGVTFVYAGIQKLTDPQYFNHSASGYIGKQILGFAFGSPIHNFLVYFVVPHATFFGALVAFGELAIGIGTLLGLLLRSAAFFGILLSLMFFLSASWRVYPYFYGADIVFVFCWITMLIAGPEMCWLPALDTWLVAQLLQNASPASKSKLAKLCYYLLGVKETTSLPNVPGLGQGTPSSAGKQQSPKARLTALRQQQQSRRNFLWGLVTGGASMLGIVGVWQVLNRIDSSEATLPPPSTTSSGGTSVTPAAGSTSGTIAQISAVPKNSSATFTLPSNGDPGVLVHLNNGQFVAFDATCTHAGCPVSYDPGSQLLLCPCHGAQFDPAKGAAVVAGPTNTPLTSVPINVDNSSGTITISGQ